MKSHRKQVCGSDTPDIKIIEYNKVVALQRRQMIRIFAGGLAALLLAAIALFCWRLR